MLPRCVLPSIGITLLLFAPTISAKEPNLKSGARLDLGASRFQGWVSPEIVDWNNDGLNDLVVGHYSGALFVYLNHGFGKGGLEFQKIEIVRRDNFRNAGNPIWAWRFNKANCVCPGPGRISPRVVDWNGDGKKDLVIGDGRGAQTRVWKNIGTDFSPEFSTHHLQYYPDDAGIRPYHETVQPCIADWNGDGKNDLMMGRNRGIYFYLNRGTETEPRFDFDSHRLGQKVRDVFPVERLSPVVVDWDADGKQDLIVGSQTGEVWFARNVGSRKEPRFEDYSRVKAGGKEVQVSSEARLAVGDLDGDGQQDLLVGGDNGVIWFFQAANPNLVAYSRVIQTKRNRPVPILLNGTSAGDRPLKHSVLTQPLHGTLTGKSPAFNYTPNEDFEGTDRIAFIVSSGVESSKPAEIQIHVQPLDTRPKIESQPSDQFVVPEQSATFKVVATGSGLSYQWHADGAPIPRATTATYFVREAAADATFSVTVKNRAGAVTSRVAKLRVKPAPTRTDDVPVVDIKFQSPVIEPATAGVLTITRSGNKSVPVIVNLITKRAHDPVVADIHFVPTPSSISLKAGQTSAELRVEPIDDTLVNGRRQLTFKIVPSPTYRLASKLGAATMYFLDDDCPDVNIAAAKDEPNTFYITANPAPRRDTVVDYQIAGNAVANVDYEQLSGQATIPAGKTKTTIRVQPFQRSKGSPLQAKTVTLTLPIHRFTFFDFYTYLSYPKREASLSIAYSDSDPKPPSVGSLKVDDPSVAKIRDEVAKLGSIVFTAQTRTANNKSYDLFAIRADGTGLKNLTDTPDFDEFSARVSSDGQRILYRRLKAGHRFPAADLSQQDVANKAIKTLPLAGDFVVRASDGKTHTVGKDGALVWASFSPDGKQIACLEEKPAEVDPNNATSNRRPAYQIVIRDSESFKEIKSMRSFGIDSQLVWSPDGKRICGQANVPPGKSRSAKGVEYPLGIGKMVSVEFSTGRRTSMSKFPDWYPVWASDSDGDWFQGGSAEILHSANNYGICPAYHAMLFRSGLNKDEPSKLVFAQYMNNIWGGCTSPDDKFAVFVIGGDQWAIQGKMAIVRLADGPIVRGRSKLFHEVLADHFPGVKNGPVLDLTEVPEAFDPHWTSVDLTQH